MLPFDLVGFRYAAERAAPEDQRPPRVFSLKADLEAPVAVCYTPAPWFGLLRDILCRRVTARRKSNGGSVRSHGRGGTVDESYRRKWLDEHDQGIE